MSTRDLSSILLSGEITAINLGGTAADNNLMTRGDIRTALTPLGIMLWRGEWASDVTYDENHVVTDGSWLALANKSTQQRPAPIPVGSPVYSFDPAPTFTEQAQIATIYSGHKYTFTKPGWVTELLVQVPEVTDTTRYRIVVVNETNPSAPVVTIINDPVLIADGWAKVSLGQTLVAIGTVFRAYIDALNSGTDNQVTGSWSYIGQSNIEDDPGTGNWETNNGQTLLRINKTDGNSADRGVELLGFVPGTIIQFTSAVQPANIKRFSVNGTPTDQTTYVTYPVNLVLEVGAMGLVGTTMVADVPVAQSTKYFEEVGYHLTNQPDFADVEGYLEIDGVPTAGVENNAYGLAFLFQEAVISADWDLLAYSESGGGGGSSGGAASYDFTKVSAVTVVDATYQEIARLVASRTAGLYEVKMSLTWTLNSTTTSGFMRWSTDAGVTWNEFQSEPKDITNKTAVFYAYPINHDGGVFDFRFEARKEVAGDVMTIDFLDLIFESKG